MGLCPVLVNDHADLPFSVSPYGLPSAPMLDVPEASVTVMQSWLWFHFQPAYPENKRTLLQDEPLKTSLNPTLRWHSG
nr:hypothetical protein HmN_000417400 [Hymenolepis microstoma]